MTTQTEATTTAAIFSSTLDTPAGLTEISTFVSPVMVTVTHTHLPPPQTLITVASSTSYSHLSKGHAYFTTSSSFMNNDISSSSTSSSFMFSSSTSAITDDQNKNLSSIVNSLLEKMQSHCVGSHFLTNMLLLVLTLVAVCVLFLLMACLYCICEDKILRMCYPDRKLGIPSDRSIVFEDKKSPSTKTVGINLPPQESRTRRRFIAQENDSSNTMTRSKTYDVQLNELISNDESSYSVSSNLSNSVYTTESSQSSNIQTLASSECPYEGRNWDVEAQNLHNVKERLSKEYFFYRNNPRIQQEIIKQYESIVANSKNN